MIHSTHFTLQEARSLLAEIKGKIRQMVDHKKEVDELGYNIYRHHFFTGRSINGEKYHPEELAVISILRELQAKGVVVKSINDGLIDFPSIRSNSEEVYLCWRLNEGDIEYWHGIHDGFAGRKPIDTF